MRTIIGILVVAMATSAAAWACSYLGLNNNGCLDAVYAKWDYCKTTGCLDKSLPRCVGDGGNGDTTAEAFATNNYVGCSSADRDLIGRIYCDFYYPKCINPGGAGTVVPLCYSSCFAALNAIGCVRDKAGTPGGPAELCTDYAVFGSVVHESDNPNCDNVTTFGSGYCSDPSVASTTYSLFFVNYVLVIVGFLLAT